GVFHIDGSLILPGTYHLHFKKPGKGFRIGPRNAHGNLSNNLDNDVQPSNRRTALIQLVPKPIAGTGAVRQVAGFYVETTILGGIWDDANSNGRREADESLVAGVAVELLDPDGEVVASTLTSGDGTYEFEDITPGDYRIRSESLPNTKFSPSLSGPTNQVTGVGSNGVSGIFSVGSQAKRELWIGMFGTSDHTEVSGTAFEDIDGDGIQDANEPGVSGLVVKAWFNNRRYETTTDANGTYHFPGLGAGQYKLQFELPTDGTFSPINQGSNSQLDSNANRWTGKTRTFAVLEQQVDDTVDVGVYYGPISDNAFESLRLTEIASIGHGHTEFVEIKNIGDEPVSLEGVRFVDGVEYNFSESKTNSLFPGEYLIVYGKDNKVNDWSNLESINMTGPFRGDLNREERLELVDSQNRAIASVYYDDDWFVITDREYLPWSLTAIDEDAEPSAFSTVLNWRPSSEHGGSPGMRDAQEMPLPESVVINEVLTKSSDGFNDRIELHNTTDQPIDIGHWFLGDYDGATDDPDRTLTRYRIAPGTVIPAGGYLTLSREDNFANKNDLGSNSQFGLSSFGESLHLVAADEYGEILGYSHSVEFAGTDIDISYGRVELSNGSSGFYVMSEPTFGKPNAAPTFGPIVIDQVMFQVEQAIPYVRFHNITSGQVVLYENEEQSWRVGGTIDYEFSSLNEPILPEGYAYLVGSDPREFRSAYEIPTQIPVYGPFGDTLNRLAGEVSLYRPGLENRRMLADRVEYRIESPWPQIASDVAITRTSNSIVGQDPIAWIDSTIVEEQPEFRHRGNGMFFMQAFSTTPQDRNAHNALGVALVQAQPGDANGDGVFNSRDFVQVFQAAKYGTGEIASWLEGDWNDDGLFNSSDFVTAFRIGHYDVDG
ncbi:MAG: lamin tail domain-containing protein, partial [Planctomycetales bacterium]|nr:lamin tail domain-containing protein [Planctomycetales bacterium]